VKVHVRTTTKSPNDAFLRRYSFRYATHICTYLLLGATTWNAGHVRMVIVPLFRARSQDTFTDEGD